jgi:hypothetical protein
VSLLSRFHALGALVAFSQLARSNTPLDKLLDVSIVRLRELEDTSFAETDDFFENEDPEADTLADGEDD